MGLRLQIKLLCAILSVDKILLRVFLTSMSTVHLYCQCVLLLAVFLFFLSAVAVARGEIVQLAKTNVDDARVIVSLWFSPNLGGVITIHLLRHTARLKVTGIGRFPESDFGVRDPVNFKSPRCAPFSLEKHHFSFGNGHPVCSRRKTWSTRIPRASLWISIAKNFNRAVQL